MASALPDRVSFVEAHRRFMALENPTTSVSEPSSKAFQDELTNTLKYLKKCIQQRQLDGVLSANERFFELQNTQLYALCIEYYLGMLTPKQTFLQQAESDDKRSGPTDHTRNVVHRIKFLREADVFLTEFLDRAENVGLLTEKKRREQYERLESKQFSLSRDEKIQRFQMQREMEKKLQEVQKRREEKTEIRSEDVDELDEDDMEDLEREQLLTFIQLSVVKSTEEQASINQEKDMLETMLKMNTSSEKQDLFSETHRPPPPPQGQGIEVTRINPQMEMRRETIRSGVFKPGHRLPTMTLEEYADREVADAMERQKREQEAPQGPRRYDQLVEDGDEDDEKLVEESTYKDRAWDDWKDANEKGIGNKKGSQFKAPTNRLEGTGEPIDPNNSNDAVEEGDGEDQQVEDLLEEFYSFMYEKAVLGKWQRMVSMLPATRTETQRFQETFDQLLEQYQARAHAICPVREKFFLQVFEELVREVACECPERGLVLLRVHNELQLTIEAHQTLYHNSIAYGRQKAVQAEAGVGELEKEIGRLKAEQESLVSRKKELEHKVMFLEEQHSEEEKKRQLRHAHTVHFLQTQRQELELFHGEMMQDSTWK
ncbi:hypothetical protein JG688_00005529 [Phytophthora aleatoria]|uniref:Uncharacterized protein n=1 Tax=Phytophthora aleatoria TaxID=2496075 RepID=A0A8J5J208_9STRA|nr:hypothetical protein JG688_00005529 [Phytophthora aleatoria]